MELSPDRDCIVCEKCGKRAPTTQAGSFDEIMRQAYRADFGYEWERGSLMTTRYFCSTCKLEFNCASKSNPDPRPWT